MLYKMNMVLADLSRAPFPQEMFPPIQKVRNEDV